MDDRLTELEIKFSHQDVLIEELQRTVFEQHKAIEKLEKSLKHLSDRYHAVDAGDAPEIGPANEKPPHY